ncbi:MAG: hypothetical protein AAFP77_22985 [Bacteroidota bacterium]
MPRGFSYALLPLAPDYPWYTPYQFAGNKPITFVDLDGLEEAPVNPGTFEGEVQETTRTTRIMDPQLGYEGGNDIVTRKSWFWHRGSCGEDGVECQAGWYSPEDYKEILIGTRRDATTLRPLNLRLFTRDVFGFTGKTFTEKDLSTEELVALSQVVANAMKRGSSIIEYEDYATTDSGNQYDDVVMVGGSGGQSGSEVYDKMWNSSFYALKTSFGQVAIQIVDDQVILEDQFNFNDVADNTDGRTRSEILEEWSSRAWKAGSHPYKQLRNYSSYYGSPDGEGTKLIIKIPKILIDP